MYDDYDPADRRCTKDSPFIGCDDMCYASSEGATAREAVVIGTEDGGCGPGHKGSGLSDKV